MAPFLAIQLQNDPEPPRRLKLIQALNFLLCRPSNQAQAPLILQILLRDLETEPIYCLIGLQTLQGIASVSQHLASGDGPRLIEQLITAWPQIFEWIWQHAFHLDIPRPLSTDSDSRDYLSTTIKILSFYAGYPALLRSAAENEMTGPILLSARLWYLKAKGLDTSIPSSIASLCRTYINSSLSSPDEHCTAFGFAAKEPRINLSPICSIASLNDGVSSTIGLLLRAPSAEFSAPSPDLSSIAAHIGIIVTLSRARRFRYLFINHHSCLIITNTLVSLGNLAKTASDRSVVAQCASLCVKHLCLVLEAAIGFEPILEALDAMLLPALVKCHAQIPQLSATEHDAASLLTLVLSKYLIYISARERVSKSLETIAANGFEQLLAHRSPFAVAWSAFKALAVQRAQIQERPNRIKNEIVCSNIMCRKSKPKGSMATCGRCQGAFYCCKPCQVEDWKHGDHKSKCGIPYERKNFPIATRDLRAADEVFRRDLALRLPDIRAAWTTRAAPAPVVVFDYTTHPPGFSTTTAEAHQPHGHASEKQALFWGETVGMVERARRRGWRRALS
ncbi:hypothetical protein B0H17DRAFT_1195335 [Mycena rosella]|uniref:MYND-type domain-containing protein n=1 Tax=Mycena rosella TaxID=1033263 RepID=A0AAD7GR11_MYCRO|nr:hypothetical protein B0H17DRAFT_1195335 [Mycena rosella]